MALWCRFANDFIAKQFIPSLNAILTQLQYMPVASLLPDRSPGQVPAPAVLGCPYTAWVSLPLGQFTPPVPDFLADCDAEVGVK